MGLIKRGQKWYVQLRDNGRLIRQSTGTHIKKVAQEIEAKIKMELVEGKYFDKGQGNKKTFKELAQRYMKEETIKKTPSSQRRDETSLKVLLPFFGEKLLTQISPSMINDYKLMRKAKGRKPATINREIALAKRMFNVAVRVWGWIGDNPFLRVPMETVHNERTRFLTDTEFQALIDASDDWLKPLIIVAAFTGLRKTNLLELEWKQVDFSNEWITALHTKNHQPYTVPMIKAVKDTLKELSKIRFIGSPYVFTNSDGTRVKETKLQKHFRQACKKAGIENLRWHDLRHCFGSWLRQQGTDVYTIRELMGHKDLRSTLRYSHLSASNLKESIKVLDQFQNKVITKTITVDN